MDNNLKFKTRVTCLYHSTIIFSCEFVYKLVEFIQAMAYTLKCDTIQVLISSYWLNTDMPGIAVNADKCVNIWAGIGTHTFISIYSNPRYVGV